METNIKIYSIPEIHRQMLDGVRVDEETGEILGRDELIEFEGKAEEKIENTLLYVKEREVLASAIAEEIQSLQKRLKAERNRIGWLKEYATQSFESLGLEKIESSKIRIKWRMNAPSVLIEDEGKIPELYWKHPAPVLDKIGLLADLKAGVAVDGASMIRKRSLTYK